MYSKELFGNYYPSDSFIHRINPIIKLINFILLFVSLIFANNLYVVIYFAFLTFILTLLSYVPTSYYFKIFYSLRYIYVFIVILYASLGFYLEDALILILKIVTIIEYLTLIMYTTSTSELSYGIEKLLRPFNIFNINLSKLSMFVIEPIVFIPSLIITGNKILKSQSSRGIDYYNSDIFGKIYSILHVYGDVIRKTVEKEKLKYENMKVSFFDIKKKRTNLNTNKIGFYDIMFTLFYLIGIFVLLMSRGYLNELFNKFNL